MPNEDPTGFRIAGEQPPISVGTAVNLARPNGRELLHALTLFKLDRPIKWKGRVGDAPRGLFSFDKSAARWGRMIRVRKN
jgi:hypothetical protein